MAFFGKKVCSTCGGKIGLLGNRKLQDGNVCKDCTKKLSPYFSERRQSTVAEIEKQLAYREANRAAVAAFEIARTMGSGSRKLFLDERAQKFIISSERRWQETNPDILDFDQVTGYDIEIDESKTELYKEAEDGKREAYVPPRYEYDYNFYITVFVNSPWFDKIRFQVNGQTIKERYSHEYREAERQLDEIRSTLDYMREGGATYARSTRTEPVNEEPAATINIAEKKPNFCTNCGASAQGGGKFCEHCGTAL